MGRHLQQFHLFGDQVYFGEFRFGHSDHGTLHQQIAFGHVAAVRLFRGRIA
ncbi:MAG: hypothetical protein IPG11_11760 [Flavobacteriales bacterium]|nr:hypothetical protein [Flavobacteriales bacterium]